MKRANTAGKACCRPQIRKANRAMDAGGSGLNAGNGGPR